MTVSVSAPGSIHSIDHVVFMLQENHSFDNYFGMLNPYRVANNWTTSEDGQQYTVDGIDDKLGTIKVLSDEQTANNQPGFSPFKFTSTCVDDETSSWLESYGQVNRYDFTVNRAINMDGFVHTAEGFGNYCAQNPGRCAGTFTDTTGQRAMGYYDQDFLNYYYYMASQFAVSDRWFTPVSSKSIPNRIATYTGGTTQGLAFNPFNDDGFTTQLNIPTIFGELEAAHKSWKIYYTTTDGHCKDADDCSAGVSAYPATTFTFFQEAHKFLYVPQSGEPCAAPTVGSSAVGDQANSFCIDPTHIAPLDQYFRDVKSGNLPSYAFIEAGYGFNDEHPGSGQSVLAGQMEVAKIVNAFMTSSSWKDSVFFLSYDESGGPYDHVPPVPGHSNDKTNADLATFIPVLSSQNIAVNADDYKPCAKSSDPLHCDLVGDVPGVRTPQDAPAVQGFAAQLGFRVPNMIISPFTRKHYVSHIPMDHTAIDRFVENLFIGPNAHLTNRDLAQPDLLNFFDFSAVPWSTPPTPPAPYQDPAGTDSCHAFSFAPSSPGTN